MNAEEQKQSVMEHYDRVAKNAESCCGPKKCGCGGNSNVEVFQFRSTKDSAGVVAQETDLGLSCGAPTEFAEFAPGQTVLDLGSGAGIDVFLAAREVGSTGMVIGLDMTDSMLERANAAKEKFGFTNVEFRKGEIESMPVEPNSIDRILSNCVINLVPDKNKAFAEIYRVLKPGGKFIISDMVSLLPIPDQLRKDAELWAMCISGALEKDEYMAVVHKAGFVHAQIISEKKYPLPEGVSFPIVSITVKGMKPSGASVRLANEHDYSAIEALLSEAALPIEGVRGNLKSFFAAEQNGVIIGVGGLEQYGDHALLRSLVVAGNYRGSGIGTLLHDALMDQAKQLRIKTLVLLTTTASKYFERKGFRTIDRAALTGPVTQSIEFTSACPSFAICMIKEL
jgi:ubiquinone/menaquinone biosynthesis C-methylase UbiE/N-acetylglutamate synthase-like GNAT family acetyltransferase